MHHIMQIYETRIEYDGPHESVDCSIDTQNQGKNCSLVFDFDRDVPGPLYVYYELEQYYQVSAHVGMFFLNVLNVLLYTQTKYSILH
jgi:hypothetical protein